MLRAAALLLSYVHVYLPVSAQQREACIPCSLIALYRTLMAYLY